MNNIIDISNSMPEDNIGFLIYRTGLRMKLHLQRVFNEKGYSITTDHWGILQLLFVKGSLSQQELADRLEKDKANITRILHLLEKKGFIERQTDLSDRRKYLISLTAKATETVENLIPFAQSVMEESLMNLSEKDIRDLSNTLNHIYWNSNASSKTGGERRP
jgi:MarR family transcriptional regulator for hemolysin